MLFLSIPTGPKAVKRLVLPGLLALSFLAGLPEQASADLPKTVTLRNFFGEGFRLERPVAVAEMPGLDSVFVVTQQSGATILLRHLDGVWVRSTFDSVAVGGVNSGTAGQDGGLLGFAFHPDYIENGRYYLYYVGSYATVRANPGRILFEERVADMTRRRRDTTIAPRLILGLDKPYIYHNGGTLKFGEDGYLYTAIGDGGSSGDPQNRAQSRDSIWGKFLRIDVDGPDAYPDDPDRNYGIPADNPFVDSAGYLPEIYALGARSPWKWDWNPFTGDIWMGDIGQSRYEEITMVPRGGNLGWKIREAAYCFPSGSSCDTVGLVPPVFTFPNRAFGQSVTGGVFFIGEPSSAYHGVYVYGDFHHNRLYAMRVQHGAGVWTDTVTLATVVNLVSLDKDRRGRILATSMSTDNSIGHGLGVVYALESPDMVLTQPPVRLSARKERARAALPVTRAELLRDRSRYTVTGLDGRVLRGDIPRAGTVIVRERGGGPSRLLMLTE